MIYLKRPKETQKPKETRKNREEKKNGRKRSEKKLKRPERTENKIIGSTVYLLNV